MSISKEKILEALASVQEPDLKKDLVELDLVSNIVITDKKITFSVKVHNPAMHNKKKMQEACEFAIQRFIGKDVQVEVDVIPLPVDRPAEQRKYCPTLKILLPFLQEKVEWGNLQ
jgi:ATP-binding protein involved in chromosome partitioning